MKKILVVDDEPSMREMLGIMLRKEGYQIVLAESRAVAANVLAKSPVDMVITDLRLPDGDGIEILRHVKAQSPETAVVVMTAFGTTQTAVAALKLERSTLAAWRRRTSSSRRSFRRATASSTSWGSRPR
jgi:two-component system, NtrC family, response regulator PilR